MMRCLLTACMFLAGGLLWAQSDFLRIQAGPITEKSMKWGFPADQTGHYLTPKQVEVALEAYSKQIEARKKVGYEVYTYPNWTELRAALIRKEVNLIVIPALQYLREPDTLPCRPILTPLHREGEEGHYVVLTHVDSGIDAPADLVGQRRLEYINGPPDVVQTWYLEASGQTDKGLEQNTVQCKDPNKAMFPVFFQQSTQPRVCLVPEFTFDLMKELNPSFEKKLQVVLRSPAITLVHVFVHTDSAVDSQLLVDTFVEINRTPAGKQIAALTRSSNIVPFDPKYLKGVRDIMSGQLSPKDPSP